MLARDERPQPSVPMILGSQFLGFLRNPCPHGFFSISVERLSLNVADDSAKTLSVLGNMGDFLDDCRLRFV